jgi:hypothetical protein
MMLSYPDSGLAAFQKRSLFVGAFAAVVCLAAAWLDAAYFFRSWLLAFCFWISVALGCLGVLMLHNLVGGRWGALLRRFLESGSLTLPGMALLALPILIGIPWLYEWAHPEAVAHDHVLAHKAPYLNVPFFIARTILYFAIWIGLAFWLRGRAFSPGPAPAPVRAISAPGVIVFVFSVTFAAVDWIMSLEPHWFSTMYGAIFVVGQALAALAAGTILVIALDQRTAPAVPAALRHDLGNMLLAFTCLWAYTSFSQFLIIWSGNIPEETPWYLRRVTDGWQAVSVFLILFHFFVPLAILLSRRAKRSAQWLAGVCWLILLVRLVDLLYWIEPSFEHHTWAQLLWVPLCLTAIGGLWIWLFLYHLRRGPLVNQNDPRLQEAHP